MFNFARESNRGIALYTVHFLQRAIDIMTITKPTLGYRLKIQSHGCMVRRFAAAATCPSGDHGKGIVNRST